MSYSVGDIIKPTSFGVECVRVKVLGKVFNNHCRVVHVNGPHSGLMSDNYNLLGTVLVIRGDITPVRYVKGVVLT